MLLLSILLPYLCNGIFISKEHNKNNVAHSNWMHKTFCYFTAFVYRQNKWSRILAPVRGESLVSSFWLRVNLGTVSLLGHSVIHLSVTYFCWANHYLLVGCLWIHPQNDMKAITLHKIRDISQKNRSDMTLEIAFLSLASCLILYAFHCSFAVRIGRRQLRFAYDCAWPFAGSLYCLAQNSGTLGVVAEKISAHPEICLCDAGFSVPHLHFKRLL